MAQVLPLTRRCRCGLSRYSRTELLSGGKTATTAGADFKSHTLVCLGTGFCSSMWTLFLLWEYLKLCSVEGSLHASCSKQRGSICNCQVIKMLLPGFKAARCSHDADLNVRRTHPPMSTLVESQTWQARHDPLLVGIPCALYAVVDGATGSIQMSGMRNL